MWLAELNEVVLTDESRIYRQHHDGRIRVWRNRGERMLQHHHTGPAPGIMIELLPWPSLSRLFADRTHVVHGCSTIDPDYTPAATPDELWQRVEAAWSAVPQEHNQNLFESMPRAVDLCDSKAAVFAVNFNSPFASSSILECKNLLQSLSEYSKQIVLQWIHGHCDVTGNEFADHLAKKGASIQQITRKAVPFTSVRRIIQKKLNDFSSRRYPERNSNKIWWNNLWIFPCG
ncbi:transposable element Tcb1 transposase [Trichonephila clavipes]|nr:transposable element Tcb1 transposase [Trichonephila clavipes]